MGRGVVRRTKRRRDPDKIIDMSERKALDYLESELKINIGSPGNADEVARIIKAIRSLRAQVDDAAPESNERTALQRQFGFDAGVAPERDGAGDEAEPGGDQEA